MKAVKIFPVNIAFTKLQFLLLLMLIFSCSGNKSERLPVNIYPRDSMVSILAEVHIAEAQINHIGFQPNLVDFRSAFMQNVFLKNNIDTSRFNSSFEYYSSQPDTLASMYDDVIVLISQRQVEVKGDNVTK